MRISIILNCLYGGGAERIAGYLSKYLSQEHEVFLFLENPENIVYDYGGQIIDVGKDGSEYLEYNVKVAKIKYNIDVSISHMEQFNHINIRTRGRDIVIVTEHNSQRMMEPRVYVDEIQNKNLYFLADHIVAVSEGVRNEIIEDTGVDPKDVSTIYNFFECKEVRLMSEKYINLPIENSNSSYEIDECKLIMSIGRLVEQKDHVRLLKQFEILHRKNKRTKLLIIGSGKLESFLKDMISNLKLDDSIFILPYMVNPFPILKSADVFVLSSRYEGYGNVLLEAMALNVPVISVDCISGPREILSDNVDYRKKITGWEIAERGILVTEHDSERTGETGYLAEAMEKVLQDDKLRKKIAGAAKGWIEKRSNMEIFHQWTDCIKKAIKKNNERELNSTTRPTKRGSYVIYGAGEYAKRVYKELQIEGIDVKAFIVSKKDENTVELFGCPIYSREFLLSNSKKYEVIMGVANWEYANQICKWFLENNIDNVIFYALSKMQ